MNASRAVSCSCPDNPRTGSRLLDWDQYKSLCDMPDVLSRWMLLQTVELLAQEPGAEAPRLLLEQTLRAGPLPKPADHRGGPLTDMFRVPLTAAEAAVVAHVVARASDAGLTTHATAARGLGGFVEAWSELLLCLAERAAGDIEAEDAGSVP